MPTTSPGVDRLLDIFSKKKKKTEAPKRRTKKELPKAFDRPEAKSKSPTKEQMAKGKRNRQALMSKMEAMGKADKAKEDARKAKARAESARKDKASGIGAVKSPVGTRVDKGFTPGKIRSVGKASTKKAEPKKTEPKKTQVKTTPAKAKVTGGGTTMKDRNVGTGASKRADVTAEQLKAAGLTTGPKGLRTYLNMYDKLGKRPKPSDFKKKAERKPFDPTKPNTGGGPGRLSIKPPKRQSAMAAAAAMGARPEDEMGMTRGGTVKKKSKGYAKGGMKSKMSTKGGMAGGKKKMVPGMMGGGMKSKMSTKGGAMGGKKKMAPGMKAGGLKPAPEGNKGLKKLPKEVRNKMGFMQEGGMKKSKGYAAGGKKSKMASKGGAKGGKKRVSKPKVRGAGIARKGVRPVKYR